MKDEVSGAGSRIGVMVDHSPLAGYLNSIAETYRSGFLDSDPIGIVHGLRDGDDVEAGAFLASALALGRVATIREKTADLFLRFENRPAGFLRRSSRGTIEKSLRGFRHRFFGEDEFLDLVLHMKRILLKKGSLEAVWPGQVGFDEALDRFATEFSSPARPGRVSTIPLVSSPAAGSTCKRLLMFLRWMVRTGDGVDFGLWKTLSPSELVIPMDTHIFRISRLLGLTTRKTPNWKAAVEVTARLKEIDPDDPVRFDFALARIGIVQGCRAKYVARICGSCPLLPVCDAARHHKPQDAGSPLV